MPVGIVEVLQILVGVMRLADHHDAAVAQANRPLDFGDRLLDTAQVRNDGQRHIPIADLDPLGQRVVVRAHTVELEFGVALKERRALDRIVGKDDLRIQAILVQGLQPFNRVVNVARHLVPTLWECPPQRVVHDRRTIDDAPIADELAVDEPALDRIVVRNRHVLAFGGVLEVGDGVAPLFPGHSAGERVLVELGV